MDIYKGKKNDSWQTPQELWNDLHKIYEFTIDLAASAENAKCNRFFSLENSFLDQPTNALQASDVFWMNPPFSCSMQFFAHLAQMKNATGVAIYKASNLETQTWQKFIFPAATWAYFLSPRVAYEFPGETSESPPFGSALIGYGSIDGIHTGDLTGYSGYFIQLNV